MLNSAADQPRRRLNIKKMIWGFIKEFGIYFIAVVVTLLIGSIFIGIAGGDVLKAYETIYHVSLGNIVGFAQTLNKWTPLLLGSLAVAIGVRGGLMNIGVDGQIYAGAIAATMVGLALNDYHLPASTFFPVVMLAGVISGALYGGIAGALKVLFNANEILVTVMLNSVAFILTQYLTIVLWNDPQSGEAISLPIASAANIPKVISRGGGHAGIFVAIGLVILVWFLLDKTSFGYSIRALGDNPQASKVGGINCGLLTFLIMCISGSLAGLAGSIEVAGVHHRLILGLSPGYGGLSILIAFVGKNKPIGILLMSFFFAVLLVGSDSLQRSVGLPASAVLVFQAVMFLSIIVARAIPALKKR
jgi:general nucleoside transport system permease protein